MRHYEIKRCAFEITNENVNKTIRKEMFNNLKPAENDIKLKKIRDNQQIFVNSLRGQMEEGKPFEDIAKYKNKIMVVIASPDKDNEYIIVIFDKEVTGKGYLLKIDTEIDKIYIEDGGIINE